MFQKSFDGTPSLYLVATPIGNLDDITIRAINILKEVSCVFAEDTRVSKKLFDHFEIKTKLYSAYDQIEDKSSSFILSFLNEGKSVALISDAGTPLINDPGYKIVKKIVNSGFNVISIPGATAFIPALIASGLVTYPFYFFGFLNSKAEKRKKELLNLKNKKDTLIFYETPHRIEESLKDMFDVFGDRKISISREVTKKFEEIFRGNISDYLFSEKIIKGEYVIVVSGSEEEEIINYIKLIQDYIDEGLSKKAAIIRVAKEYNISKNDLYNDFHQKGE